MINKITVQYLCKSWDRKSLNSPLGCIQLTYIKSIDMLNKNTPGVKKKRGQVGSTS